MIETELERLRRRFEEAWELRRKSYIALHEAEKALAQTRAETKRHDAIVADLRAKIDGDKAA